MTAKRDRTAQKSRTREAILGATRDLMSEGLAVTVIAAADRAGVSKATAYRYFSDPAVLVAEAGLDVAVLPYDRIVAGAEGVRAKVLAISLYFLDLALDHEAEFRQFVGLTLLAWTPDDAKQVQQRGGRRIPMFEAAIADASDRLTPEDRAAMVRALAATTGAEAMIALYDVIGAERDQARDTVAQISGAIVDRYLPGI